METFSQLIVDGNLINSTVNIDDQPQYRARGPYVRHWVSIVHSSLNNL